MDNSLGTQSVDWSLINIWCCGKFFSSVDLSAHAELCHAAAASSYEENRCGAGTWGRTRRTGMFDPHAGGSFLPAVSQNESSECHQKFGKPEESKILSPVKQVEYWSKKRKDNAKVINEENNETYNNSNLRSSKTRDEFTSSSKDTKDFKDTCVDTNDVKGDTEIEMVTISDDMPNISDEDANLKLQKELAQQKLIHLPSRVRVKPPPKVNGSPTVIKPGPIVSLKVTSTKLMKSNYQMKVTSTKIMESTAPELRMRAEGFVMCEEVPPVANYVEASEQIEKPLGRAKLKKPYMHSCAQCDYKSKLKGNLRNHQMGMHSAVWHKCDQCDYKSRWIVSLKRHVEVHKELSYPCQNCDYKGTSRATLKLHLAQHEGVTYNCDQCVKKYKYKWNLEAHKVSAHVCGGEKRFSCDQCDYKAKWKRNVKEHKEFVHEGITYSCDQCDYKAKNKFLLKRHLQIVHKGLRQVGK